MQLSLKTLSVALGLAVAAIGAPTEAVEATDAARDCNPNFYMCSYQSLPHSWYVCDYNYKWKYAGHCDTPAQQCTIIAGLPYCI
ncbi:hypothetical protein ONS95_012507 [Cadophora gregata]|uniref:uncharacterized protein n=1 Tax=Cadophora gregata TaxID=51156 RepID=UPI0026DC139B|nr:uncharacterized protein ONS95_012507 [Cadophora gregata]KAK0118203.1 hypothetical protein ONS95_012507 [Cadophora gregata]KAK0123276.1 hypothetical protein ONS96_010274 [Cadophora gregata f. sp. sojae]